MDAMLDAMRTLTGPTDTGAATICLSQDVQGEAWDYLQSFFARRAHLIERRPPDPQRLTMVRALIACERRPLVVCGGGVRYFGVHETFRMFAKTLQLPFAETQAGKGALVSGHSLNLGGIGVTGGVVVNQLAPQADLVIGIGTRLTDFITGSKALSSHLEAEFLLLNVAEFDVLKFDATALIADARIGLMVLTKTLKDYRSDWGKEVAQAQEAQRDEYQRLWERDQRPDDEPEVAGHLDAQLAEYGDTLNTRLTQTKVLGLINQHVEDNATAVGAAGPLPDDLQHTWQVKTPDSYHLEYGYPCMGYEIAAAIGARLAKPQQPVHAMMGDGPCTMLHSRLQTAVQEGIRVTILLFDNANFGCTSNLQMGHRTGSFGTENRHRSSQTGRLDGPLVKTDFAKNAESYGCRAWRARDERSPLAALEASRMHSGLVLLDVKVLPKTMTHNYASWWRTGDAQVVESPSARRAAGQTFEQVKNARQY